MKVHTHTHSEAFHTLGPFTQSISNVCVCLCVICSALSSVRPLPVLHHGRHSTAGVTVTTGSQLHTSVFDQNRRLTHARTVQHVHASTLQFQFEILARLFIYFPNPSLLREKLKRRLRSLICTPVNVQECLYLSHLFVFLAKFVFKSDGILRKREKMAQGETSVPFCK